MEHTVLVFIKQSPWQDIYCFSSQNLPTSFLPRIYKFLPQFSILSHIYIYAVPILASHFSNVNFNMKLHVQMSQVANYFQNIGLKFSGNFICPVHFIHFSLFIVAYRECLESRFRYAGQYEYFTVTAFPFSVLLETFGSAVVKLAVLLSFSAAAAQ